MNITPHFTLDEFCASDLAVRQNIDNTPGPDVLQNLVVLAEGLERVRYVLSVPIHISSGYRSPQLNAALTGASRASAHMKGLAADFVAPQFGTPLEICRELLAHADFINFDQLIHEGGRWVHIAFGDMPRKEVLTAHFDGGKATYMKGLA